MKKIIFTLIFLFIVIPLKAEPEITTIRHYGTSSWKLSYSGKEYPKQFAWFNLEKPCYVKKIRIGLSGNPGSVRLRLFGSEGGSMMPNMQRDLMTPLTVTRNTDEPNTIVLEEIEVNEEVVLDDNYFFVGIDNITEGVFTVYDYIDHRMFCDGSDQTMSSYMILIDTGDVCHYYPTDPKISRNTAFYLELDVEYINDSLEVYLKDVTKSSGLNTQDPATSYAWGDFNNDSWIDLVVAGTLYMNKNGQFTNITEKAGLNGMKKSRGDNKFIDMNNDGLLDIIYLSTTSKTIYLNNGDETFESVGLEGIPFLMDKSSDLSGIAIADVNSDKYPDLFVTQNWTLTYPEDTTSMPNYLLINDQNNGFIDETIKIYPENEQNTSFSMGGARWIDYDNDGDMDLHVINALNQTDELYSQTHDGNFHQKSPYIGLDFDDNYISGSGTGGEWADYDNDGDMDLLLSQVAYFEDVEEGIPWTTIYKNKGDGTFEEQDGKHGLKFEETFGSGTWGDINNDGLLDIFLPNFYKCRYSAVYQQKPDHTFELKTYEYGMQGHMAGDWNYVYSGTFADYNNDGKLDLLTSRFGTIRLYENIYPESGNFVEIDLLSESSNTFAVGANVTVHSGNKRFTRQVSAGSGVRTARPYRLHFGLGNAVAIDSIVVRWPSKDNRFETFGHVSLNTITTLREGDGLTSAGEDYSENFSTSISPNPFNSYVDLKIVGLADKADIVVFDILGNRLKEFHFSSGLYGTIDKRIRMDGFSPGVYLVNIRSGSINISEKIIKLK